MKNAFKRLLIGAALCISSVGAFAGWPMTDANPQIKVSSGQIVGLYFGQTIPGAYGLALTYANGQGQEWLGALLDPNFDQSILGDPAKWNAWLAKMDTQYTKTLPQVVHVDPPIASDATPTTVDEVRAWINQHTTFKIGPDGYPIIVGK